MKYRIRSESWDEPIDGHIHWYLGLPPGGSVSYVTGYRRWYNYIRDETGRDRSRDQSGHVYHQKGYSFHIPITYTEYHMGSAYSSHDFDNVCITAFYPNMHPNRTLESITASSAALNEAAGDGDSSFNSRAYEAMLPSLEGDVSLTNFLLELSDVSHLLRFFTTKSGLLRKISEGHLNYSFGIKPMIRDVAEIYNSLWNYEKRIKDFMERANTPQKRYYRETGEDSGSGQWSASTGVPGLGRNGNWSWQTKVTRVATMTYSYDVAPIEGTLRKLQALRAMLGLRFTPSVIWEAIPFSFLLDWIVDVGSWLRSRESDLIQPTVLITDYTVSYKVFYVGQASYDAVWPNPAGSFGPVKVFDSKGSVYVRRRVLPDTNGSPLSFGELTPNKLALSFSLLNVRR